MWISELPILMLKYLLLTVIIETLLAIAIGMRDKKDLFNVVLVNIVTNPLVNSIPVYFEYQYGMSARTIALYTLEIFTVLFEGLIYNRYLKYKKVNGFLLSFLLNLFSYLVGVILNSILY